MSDLSLTEEYNRNEQKLEERISELEDFNDKIQDENTTLREVLKWIKSITPTPLSTPFSDGEKINARIREILKEIE